MAAKAIANLSKCLSVYLHWPYCSALCTYCDFNKYINKAIPHDRLIDCYVVELQHFLAKSPKSSVQSVYFGGGTPSLALPSFVEKIMTTIAKEKSILPGAEVCIYGGGLILKMARR